MDNSKCLFRNDLKSSFFHFLPISLMLWWLEKGEKHRTFNPSRWLKPKFKFDLYWSGSIEKPHEHVRIFFHRLDFFISTPCFIKAHMKKKMEQGIFKMNEEVGNLCPDCSSPKLLVTRGFAYEPIIYCVDCSWMEEPEDITPYII